MGTIRQILLIGVVMVSFLTIKAQDIIQTKSGDTLNVKVLEVYPYEVKFKKNSNMDGPIYVLTKDEVAIIIYKNGTFDSLKNYQPTNTVAPSSLLNNAQAQTKSNNPPPTMNQLMSQKLYLKARTDAINNYDTYHGAGTACFFASALSFGVLGLIVAPICESSIPSDRNLGLGYTSLTKNPEYHKYYMQEAMRIKSRKVWGNVGNGVLFDLLFGLLIAGAMHK
jgi:hypothetical protein